MFPPNAGAAGGAQFAQTLNNDIIVEDPDLADLDGYEDNYDAVVRQVRNERPVMLQVEGNALVPVKRGENAEAGPSRLYVFNIF